MLTDRYGLALSSGSAAARDDYVEASDLALTFYPGAAEAYDRAIAEDPRFALAHGGKAQVLMRQGDVAAAQAALAVAKDVSVGLSEREASHTGFFDLLFAGRSEAAIAALYPHLAAWPRDALVVSVAANPNGVIGGSGRITPWRCPRMGSSRRPERRSSNRWRQIRTTHMARMASPMSATRAAKPTRLTPFSRRGSPHIRTTGFSMGI
jgi:Tetratricopeptide repeat